MEFKGKTFSVTGAASGMGRATAAEYHQSNIRVAIIIGGRIRTNISRLALEKDGSEHKKLDPGQERGISPEKAARQICRGLRKEKREIRVGGGELVMLDIRRFFPWLYYYLARRISPF